MTSFVPQRFISKFLFHTPKPQNRHLTATPCFHILHFSTTPPTNPLYPSRRHEEESRNVRVSVWWDFENCSLPANVNVFKVAQFITAAVRANGIKGPVSITAFGDVIQLSRANQEALSATGVNLTHIPNGGKNSADRSLLVDLMYWVSQNPPPAHLFLISGDRDFASVLHRLRMNNYNILLASSDSAPGVLCSSASIMWQWSTLVKGENLTGKVFNQPPDGPYASWYGHYKAPLEDPFAGVGQPSNIRADEVSECGPYMLRPIPMAVIKQIRKILNSYPKGVSAVDLRTELGKSNVNIDKDYFGYRKFSRFLLAMPQILNIKSDTSGQYLVHGIPTKINGENDSTTRSSLGPIATKDEGHSSSTAAKQNGQKSSSKESAVVKPLQRVVSEPKVSGAPKKQPGSMEVPKVSGAPTKQPGSMEVRELPKPYTEGVSEKLSPPFSLEQIVGTPKMQDCGKSQEPSEGAQETASVVQEDDKTKLTHSEMLVRDDHSSVSEPGISKKILKWWFGSENSDYNAKENTKVNTTLGPRMNTKEKKKTNLSDSEATVDDSSVSEPGISKKISKWWSGSENGVFNAKEFAKANTTSGPRMNTKEKKKTKISDHDNSEVTVDNPAQASGLFNKVTSWFRSWRSLEESDNGSSEKSQKPDSSGCRLFSKDSFWSDMKAFLVTPNGSSLVLQAKTRSQMGQALQRDGPPALLSLSEDDLLQLVDILISDKKWVEESAFLSSPFKLVEIAPEDAHGGSALSSSVSSSVVSGMQLQSGSVRRHQLSGVKKCQNLPHAGVTQPARLKPDGKSKSEILADCKNLVQFIVKKHPEGYNVGLFKNLFLERFGYPLELQKLGYTKLATLLQIMPGIRIESTHIVPSGKVPLDSALEDLVEPSDKFVVESQKDEGNESPWDELGPLSAAVSDEKNTKSKEAKEKMKGQVQNHYELLSDDDFSDSSEDETTLSTYIEGREQQKGSEGREHRKGGEGREQRKLSEGENSLLKILDSWYDGKEGSIGKSTSENVDSSDEYIENGTSAACRSGKSGEIDISSFGRQKRPAKSYSFVADQQVDEKENLIDGILGSFKKSGEK